MEIVRSKTGDTLVLALTGRLDATWADAVESALAAAVRAGEHHLALDLAGVDYISSAGLRVLINGFKQIKSVHGRFDVRRPQEGVRKVIELSGLAALLSGPADSLCAETGADFTTSNATWQRFGEAVAVTMRGVGGATPFSGAPGEAVEFSPARFGFGVAALAATAAEAAPRLGEFLAVAGCAAHLPAGEGNRPDFLLAEQALVPAAWMVSGLVAEGTPQLLLRFEATGATGRISLREIARTALENAGGAAAFVLVAETAGLVGAALRRAPAADGVDPFAFPAVRDWLSFTSERAHRDTTSIVVGLVAAAGGPLDASLRPLDEGLLAHAHAVVFPYRPIRKGAVALDATVRTLFEGGGLQAVLHLLRDTREPDGAGDSEFLRGACWIAPLQA